MYEDFLREHGITKYRVAEISGISYSVIQDLFFGKTSVLNCSYPPLAKAHTPQTMRIRPFAALSSIGVHPSTPLSSALQNTKFTLSRPCMLLSREGMIRCIRSRKVL